MSEPTQRMIESNGIRLNIAEQGEGPPVLLCHGFPESWYSWRHQIDALAAAGFHSVAPDMRGYGKSDAPEGIDQYTIFHLVGDMVGLLDALEVPVIIQAAAEAASLELPGVEIEVGFAEPCRERRRRPGAAQEASAARHHADTRARANPARRVA